MTEPQNCVHGTHGGFASRKPLPTAKRNRGSVMHKAHCVGLGTTLRDEKKQHGAEVLDARSVYQRG